MELALTGGGRAGFGPHLFETSSDQPFGPFRTRTWIATEPIRTFPDLVRMHSDLSSFFSESTASHSDLSGPGIVEPPGGGRDPRIRWPSECPKILHLAIVRPPAGPQNAFGFCPWSELDWAGHCNVGLGGFHSGAPYTTVPPSHTHCSSWLPN